MSNFLATPARIRLCVREQVFAEAESLVVLARHPDAEDMTSDPFESFFTKRAHAQSLLNERFAIMSVERPNEQINTGIPLLIGEDFHISPNIPIARCVDRFRKFDQELRVTGFSIDFGVFKFNALDQ